MIDTILLDLDGVLVDFFTPALELFGKGHLIDSWTPGEYRLHPSLGITEAEFWRAIDAEGIGWWEDLPPYPWCHELYDFCKGKAKNVYIATSPSRYFASAAGKVRWLQEQFGAGFRDYMIGPHKHLMAKPGVLLIDDSDANIDLFSEHGGPAILFPRPWNSLHAVSGEATHIVTRTLERILA